MHIQFLGAARTVTGSKHLITLANGQRILLDCGLFQDQGDQNDELNAGFNFEPGSIDWLILSHAHMDHSGNIPNLVRQGFRGKIYCTEPTYDLCRIMLADSARIQEGDAEYINKKRRMRGEPPIEPLYTEEDVQAALEMFVSVDFRQEMKLSPEVSFTFTEVGHILGAACTNLVIREGARDIRLAYTADIGRETEMILKRPQPFPQCDILITESTYGNRLHDDVENMEGRLLEVVQRTCVEKKGKLIIPAFSLGRTQEVVYALDRLTNQRLLPPINVYVDSPLSTNATDIMRRHMDCFNEELHEYIKTDPDPFGFARLHYIRNVEESKRLNTSKEPCIIISASGMVEAGRVVHHVKNNIGHARNTILLVGYCSPRSLGGQLRAGKDRVRIFGEFYDVQCDVEVMDSFSAHGDFKEMIDYLGCQDPKQIDRLFLVHGEYETQKAYKQILKQAGYTNIEIPNRGQEFLM